MTESKYSQGIFGGLYVPFSPKAILIGMFAVLVFFSGIFCINIFFQENYLASRSLFWIFSYLGITVSQIFAWIYSFTPGEKATLAILSQTPHPIALSLSLVWFVLVWSFFGGAIARIVALNLGKDQSISIKKTLSYSWKHKTSLLGTPLILIGAIALFFGASWLYNFLGTLVPILGPIFLVLLFILVLLSVLFLILVGIALVFGIHLIPGIIGVDGCDTVETLINVFNTIFDRTWYYLLYTALLIISIVIIFLLGGIFLDTCFHSFHTTATVEGYSISKDWKTVKVMTKDSVEPSIFSLEPSQTPKTYQIGFNEIAAYFKGVSIETWNLDATTGETILQTQKIDFLILWKLNKYWACIGIGLFLWYLFIQLIVWGYVWSYIISSGTMIYLLIRKESDRTEFKEIWDEESNQKMVQEIKKIEKKRQPTEKIISTPESQNINVSIPPVESQIPLSVEVQLESTLPKEIVTKEESLTLPTIPAIDTSLTLPTIPQIEPEQNFSLLPTINETESDNQKIETDTKNLSSDITETKKISLSLLKANSSSTSQETTDSSDTSQETTSQESSLEPPQLSSNLVAPESIVEHVPEPNEQVAENNEPTFSMHINYNLGIETGLPKISDDIQEQTTTQSTNGEENNLETTIPQNFSTTLQMTETTIESETMTASSEEINIALNQDSKDFLSQPNISEENAIQEKILQETVPETLTQEPSQETIPETVVQEPATQDIVQEPTTQTIPETVVQEPATQDIVQETIPQEAAIQDALQEPATQTIPETVAQQPATQDTVQESTQEIVQEPSTQEISQETASQEISPEPSTQETSPEADSQEINPETASQEINPENSTQETSQEPASQEINPENSTQETSQEPASQEINPEPETVIQPPSTRNDDEDFKGFIDYSEPNAFNKNKEDSEVKETSLLEMAQPSPTPAETPTNKPHSGTMKIPLVKRKKTGENIKPPKPPKQYMD